VNKILSQSTNLQILYEDNHLIVVNKRVGDLTQGDQTGDLPLPEHIKSYLKVKYHKPGQVFLGVVHRLDRPTSGVVVFAKTSKALARLNESFKSRETEKTYWAIVKKAAIPKTDTLTHYLIRHPKNNTSVAHENVVPNAKEAKLSYKVIHTFENYLGLEINLFTGRHHQIRCQLKAINCSIKGDLKYGYPRSNPDGGIDLHARKLKITHPVSSEILTFIAPVPDDALWRMMEN
jgi:23S rRNA pseudouridine1911/1915/1917 synthase